MSLLFIMIGWDPWIKIRVYYWRYIEGKKVLKTFALFHNATHQLIFYYKISFSKHKQKTVEILLSVLNNRTASQHKPELSLISKFGFPFDKSIEDLPCHMTIAYLTLIFFCCLTPFLNLHPNVIQGRKRP